MRMGGAWTLSIVAALLLPLAGCGEDDSEPLGACYDTVLSPDGDLTDGSSQVTCTETTEATCAPGVWRESVSCPLDGTCEGLLSLRGGGGEGGSFPNILILVPGHDLCRF